MRKLLAVGILFGALTVSSAFGADWQEAAKTDKVTTSIDKQTLKRVGGSRVRVSIMQQFAETQPPSGEKNPIPAHDKTIGDYTINCGDFTSVINRNTWYLGSKVVKVFNGPSNQLPAPPQFERGVPAAFKLACDTIKS
jgi:hypothetical protein